MEWPVVLIGGIDAEFMDLPPEVLTTAMRSHQKYFTLLNEDGSMAPRFALVSNMETADGGARIVAGNERVLRARLSDARFFWDQDRKETLSSRTTQLADITFHAKLGTLDAKVDRIQALAVEIAKHIDGADRDHVRAAARLAKADLVTGMVGEFPELQGLMGRYYALAEGEHEDGRQRDPRPLRAAGPERRLPLGADLGRRGAGRQDRHAGGLLGDRREADGIERPLRATPRRAGRDPADHRERASGQSVAAVQGRCRQLSGVSVWQDRKGGDL